ncbi:MAG: peptidylprolyl isomerase [bacterium]
MIRPPRGAVVFGLLLLAGCGGKKGHLDKVVARAGDIQVTIGDFNDAWNKITPTNRPDISTLELKRTFANDLVNQRILLAEARRLGGITDSTVLGALEQRRRGDILSALYHDEIQAKVEVKAKEVEDLYQHRAVNVRASHILLEDEETAKRVRADIEAHKITFEDAAKKYSLDQGSRLKGGSLGEIQWNATLPDFQSRAFSQEPGVISEPFQTTFGFHLLRVDERIPKKLPSLDEMRPTLRSDLQRQQEQLLVRQFSAGLEQKAGLQWNEEGLRTLRAAIDEMAKVDQDTIPSERQYLPPADEARRKVVVATFAGRDWTIGDYLRELRQLPTPNRPPGQVPVSGLKELIRTTQIDPELAYQEALARKIGDRPEIKQGMSRLEEQILIETLHARFLQAADITPEEVRAYFDSTAQKNPDAVKIPERVDMLVLAHTDSTAVKKALARIAKGEDEAKVIQEVSMDPRTNSKGGRTGPVARGTYPPQVEDVAFSSAVGKGWSKPIVTEAGCLAVRVLSKEPARPAKFEEVQPALTQNLAQAKGEKAFDDWLKKEREKRKVEVYDDALQLMSQAITGPKTPAAPGAHAGAKPDSTS